MDKHNKVDKDFSASFTEKLVNENNRTLEEKYDTFYEDDELSKYVTQDVKNMIPQIDKRINYWETRRTSFLQIGLGILGFSLAGIITLLLNILSKYFKLKDCLKINNIFLLSLLIFLLILFIGSILLIRKWNLQNNPIYPFTKATKIWKWHYRGAEKFENNIFIKNFSTRNKLNELTEQEAEKFALNLSNYKEKILSASKKELLDQDISQLYTLIINEKYKIKFLNQLKQIFIKTIVISIISLLITMPILFILRNLIL